MKNLTINDLGFKFNKNLERYNYILKPQLCSCGCGGQMCVVLDTDVELYDFLKTVISDVDCNRVLGIAIKRNNDVKIVIRWNDEIITLESMKLNKFKVELKDLIKEMHCIAAIQETEYGNYRVIHNGVK